MTTQIVLLLVALTCTWVTGALAAEQQLCGGRGNFNGETQRCDCPWGYGGDNCTQLLLPACRTSLAANASSWTCNSVPAQNCACLRQCWQMYCASQEGGVCVAHVETRARCYELDGVPEEEQISDAPQHDDVRARYWEGIFPQDRRNLTREEVTKLYWGNVYAVPNSRCENSCNMRGVCHEDGVAPDQRFCGCHYGYEGHACESQQGGTCYNDCSRNGQCNRGFCHCKEGWWGLDCSRSKVFQPDPSVLPPATRLRVYMYDLPTDLAHDLLFHDPNYISYERFIETFLKDWSVRTESPHEANMFFIPSLLYYFSSNVGLAAAHLTRVIKYVQREFPYWNRTRGADHFFFNTQDRGLCHYHMEELLQESVRLVHFGYYQFNNSLWGMQGKMEACIKPSRDVVVAPNIVNALQVVTKTFNPKPAAEDPPLPERTKLLFLAGGVRMEDSEYSGGARQQIFRLYNATNSSDPDVKFVEGYVGDYEEQLRTHKFCMAPWGHGWGIRLPQVVLHGCVPVIIQDYVFQFFEDVVPYQDFSVRLSNEDIPHLGPLLRAIDNKEYARLQEGLRKVYRAFHWDEGPEPFGGLAYNLTIRSLMKRYRYRKGKLIQPTEHCNLPPKPPQDCPTPDQQQQQQQPQSACPEHTPCPVCLACPACEECPPVSSPSPCSQGPEGQDWMANSSSGTAVRGALDSIVTGLGHEQGQSSESTATSSHRGAPSLRTLRSSQGFASGAGMHAVYLLCIMAAFIAGRVSLSSLVKGA